MYFAPISYIILQLLQYYLNTKHNLFSYPNPTPNSTNRYSIQMQNLQAAAQDLGIEHIYSVQYKYISIYIYILKYICIPGRVNQSCLSQLWLHAGKQSIWRAKEAECIQLCISLFLNCFSAFICKYVHHDSLEVGSQTVLQLFFGPDVGLPQMDICCLHRDTRNMAAAPRGYCCQTDQPNPNQQCHNINHMALCLSASMT